MVKRSRKLYPPLSCHEFTFYRIKSTLSNQIHNSRFDPIFCPVLVLRNLLIIMLLGMLGLRTSTLIAINIEDIDVSCGLMWIREKGRRQRNMVLPHSICKIIHKYLQLRRLKKGPLLISKRKKRISQRTLQDIFRTTADRLGIEKKLHARLFRHTAATHLNRVAGIEITQQVLGHSRRANTLKYAHLNPDQYAVYMKKHPYMQADSAKVALATTVGKEAL
jgi:integrase/recombinase XerC